MAKTDQYITKTTQLLRRSVKGTALIAVSGGVDSMTSTMLLKRAGIPFQLICIETGYLRNGEIAYANRAYERLDLSVESIEAATQFWEATKHMRTPETKRDAFREIYFNTITDYALAHDIQYVVQGTQFYRIRTQMSHNDPTDVINTDSLHIIEPVKGLTKSEIRTLAAALGIPRELYMRKPFPGPGLLIRMSGAPTRNALQILRQASDIVDGAVASSPLLNESGYQIFPYFAQDIRLPYRDAEENIRYGSPIFIRSLSYHEHASDNTYPPLQFPEAIQTAVVEKLMAIPGVSRVLFDITPKHGGEDVIRPGVGIEYS